MAGTVNVNRSVTDQFYRYKMPRLIAKVEGKGNGIKTVIVNMVDVAKALSRPPTYPTKYFGCELGAQTYMDVKNEKFIVNGSHEANRLQDMLDSFIKRFVLCPSCDNPETDLHVHQKKGTISQRCVACGYNGPVDMKHKLTTYMLRNPPGCEQTTGSSKKDKKKEKKEKKGGKEEQSSGNKQESTGGGATNNESFDGNEEVNGDDSWGEDGGAAGAGGDDNDWGDDITDEAIARRMEQLTDGAKTMTMNEDLDKSVNDRLDLFYEYIKKYKASGEAIEKLDKEIVAEAERLDVKDKATLILCELLLSPSSDIPRNAKQYKILFRRFCIDNDRAQKYLLGGLELVIQNNAGGELLQKVPSLLKLFYDLDILEEHNIIDWASKASKKYVSKELSQEIRAKAKPFVDWLQEASEEESSSDEDGQGDDLQVVYSADTSAGRKVEVVSEAKKPTTPTTPTIPPAADPGAPGNAEDDIDIDDI